MSAWADLLRECDGRGAAAATDIDDPHPGLGPGAIDQDGGDRCKQGVLRRLTIGPVLAARSVPVGNLIRISIMAGS
jgi:hypothetical protein